MPCNTCSPVQDDSFGVLAGHTTFLTALRIDVVEVTQENQTRTLAVWRHEGIRSWSAWRDQCPHSGQGGVPISCGEEPASSPQASLSRPAQEYGTATNAFVWPIWCRLDTGC